MRKTFPVNTWPFSSLRLAGQTKNNTQDLSNWRSFAVTRVKLSDNLDNLKAGAFVI